jgi:hypothetical protein
VLVDAGLLRHERDLLEAILNDGHLPVVLITGELSAVQVSEWLNLHTAAVRPLTSSRSVHDAAADHDGRLLVRHAGRPAPCPFRPAHPYEGEECTVHIDKAEIIALLRSRGLNARADWVDREFHRLVDTDSNGSLLQMLNIDPAIMSPAEIASPEG